MMMGIAKFTEKLKNWKKIKIKRTNTNRNGKNIKY